ncbi:hypothetical protein POL68_37430 [Stigmatella sp. ncwal1]|uniref:Protein NO VEIN C-terminal domain-containing protein n=1 Tax=Stigmatella ashevillensis TaxID=2995309 RepID=A0ABT5DKM0_9BACT|nr:hypothetical protein [Stigmatella ashevillena]MDC0714206.1 hypothetical protein [Stigmatella ashevillena]
MSILQLIHDAVTSGRTPTLDEFGGLQAILKEGDVLVTEPVLDVLVSFAAELRGQDVAALDDLVLRGFQQGKSATCLRDAASRLLQLPSVLARVSKDLQRTLYARVEDRGTRKTALLAAYALEALFRMALAGAAPKHRPLALMADFHAGEDALFASRAAKLAGAAFHVWREDDLVEALERLSQVAEAEDEAAFELGLVALSRALSSAEKVTAQNLLDVARVHFDRAFSIGGGREDALAYRATIDLLQGFSDGKPHDELAAPLTELESAVTRRMFWLDVTDVPSWLRPRFDRDAQWLELVRAAKAAAENLTRPSWLNASRVMEQVLRVYDADRTIESGPGLQALLRPRIETAIARERGLLAHLNELLSTSEWQSEHREVAVLLQARIEVLAQESTQRGKVKEDVPYPLLRGILRDENVLGLSPDHASKLEAALQEHMLRQDIAASVTVQRIVKQIHEELASCRDYEGETKRDFDELLLHVLSFCADRLDGSKRERGARGAYLSKANALEGDLQSDLREYLIGNFLRADVRTEVDGVGAGRTDIYIGFGTRRFIIELKREGEDSSRSGLRKYLGQAAAYQATNVRLGFLGVLDLVERRGPPPHLEDSVWTDSFVPEGGESTRHIVVFRVSGRLTPPSNFSKL